ncbi:haloacid dehalogenase [Haloprofundus marisrubri]|uniref:Haloacid dehalogenase n=1 Tax=Haloprofundus marisrubri TaxID=1514971 RepID=A0A0W1REQ4_9EURY|nr:HAD family phosphatase [Haloprofundus marisrubri]KTG11632.1 haloacid dehalogenase [Haloprofundus marisrubri]
MDAVLFDMDGVIVDSEEFWHEIEDEIIFADVVAGTPPARDEITGMNYREIYDYLAAEYEVTVEKDEFIAIYQDAAEEIYTENVSVMPQFDALLDTLRDRGVTIAIVSSSPQSWIAMVRERFGLDPLDLVLSAEDIDGPGKPEPAVYEAAAEKLGLDPEDCVVVEDSTNGTQSAHRAGTYVVGYRTETNAETDLSAADTVVEGPTELRKELLAQTESAR